MSIHTEHIPEFNAETERLLERNRAIPVSAEDFEELCAALADLIVQVSAEPEGRMSGLSDQGTRLNWYMQLMPVRDRARAILAKVRQP